MRGRRKEMKRNSDMKSDNDIEGDINDNNESENMKEQEQGDGKKTIRKEVKQIKKKMEVN